jgi:pimeloyl-ACP methyl ester carboxylesterase
MRTTPGFRLQAVGLSLLALGSAFAPAAGQTRKETAPRPPGRLVDVGGYRLHLNATGKGSPAVVFLNGAGDSSAVWALVQPGVSKFARAVAYDRAGEGWSDLGPTPRTMRQEAHELHLLLAKAGIDPPYVLVGHSYGGLLARVYARDFPGEVAGVVLVDATHENTVLMLGGKLVRVGETATGKAIPPVQTMKSSPPRPPSPEQLKEHEEFQKTFGPPKIDPPYDRLPPEAQRLELWARSHPKLAAPSEDFWAEELRQLAADRKANPHPLGEMPLVSLAGGKEQLPAEPPPGVSAEEWARLREEKRRQKADLALLSRKGRFVVEAASGHHVHLEAPAAVVAAIRDVVDAVRSKRPAGPGLE